jgi:hypothetical protein
MPSYAELRLHLPLPTRLRFARPRAERDKTIDFAARTQNVPRSVAKLKDAMGRAAALRGPDGRAG